MQAGKKSESGFSLEWMWGFKEMEQVIYLFSGEGSSCSVTPQPQNVPVFKDRALVEVNKINELTNLIPLGSWAKEAVLIQTHPEVWSCEERRKKHIYTPGRSPRLLDFELSSLENEE